jgi:hypothetical protein
MGRLSKALSSSREPNSGNAIMDEIQVVHAHVKYLLTPLFEFGARSMDEHNNTLICVSLSADPEPETLAATPHLAHLIVVNGPMPGTMFRITEPGASVGRSGGNTLQLIDATVSRRHASFSTD